MRYPLNLVNCIGSVQGIKEYIKYMNRDKKEGPEIREIPSQRQQVCGDCKYHNRQRWFCGHDRVTDNYSCLHPDVKDYFHSWMQEGRSIAFNSAETPSTPDWCPYLNDKP